MKKRRFITIHDAAEEIYKKARREWKKEVVINIIKQSIVDAVINGNLHVREPDSGFSNGTGFEPSESFYVNDREALSAAETEGVFVR